MGPEFIGHGACTARSLDRIVVMLEELETVHREAVNEIRRLLDGYEPWMLD